MTESTSKMTREEALGLWIELLNMPDSQRRQGLMRRHRLGSDRHREFNLIMSALLFNAQEEGDTELFERVKFLTAEISTVFLEGKLGDIPDAPTAWARIDPQRIEQAVNAPGFSIYWHEQLTRMGGDSAETQLALGDAHVRRRAFSDALGHYKRAIELDPYNPRAHVAAGLVYIDLGRPDEAIPHLNDGAEAYEFRQQDFDDLSERDIEIWTIACNHLTGLLRARGKFKDAVRCAEMGARARPDGWQYKVLADCYRAAGRHDEAIAAARKAVLLDPGCAEAHNSLGILLRDQFDFEGAVRAFEDAIRANPDLVQAHNNLGTCLKALGRMEEAQKAYREAIGQGPERPAPLTNLANVARLRGDFQEAELGYRKALSIDEDYGDARLNLATLYLDTDRWREAVRELNLATASLIKSDLSPASKGIPDPSKHQQPLEFHPVYFSELNKRYTDLRPVINQAYYEYIAGAPSEPQQGDHGTTFYVAGQAVETWTADGMVFSRSYSVSDWTHLIRLLGTHNVQQYLQQVPDPDIAILAMHLLADAFLKQSWIREALWVCGHLEAVPLSSGSSLHLAKTYNHIGQTFRKGYSLDAGRALHSLAFARAIYRHAYDRYEKENDRKYMAIMLYNMAVAYQVEGKLNQAIDFYRQSQRIDEQIGNKKAAKETSRRISDLGKQLKKLGNRSK